MIDTSPFTEAQWTAMCGAQMDMPVPLHQADLQQYFVWERAYGVFYVPFAFHDMAMTTLLAFSRGHESIEALHAAETPRPPFSEAWSDEWLRQPGTALRSSAIVGSPRVRIGFPTNVTHMERRIFQAAGMTLDPVFERSGR